MADDIVTRLRAHGSLSPCWEAADVIERLRSLITEWHAARNGPHWIGAHNDEWHAACDRLEAAEDALTQEAHHD